MSRRSVPLQKGQFPTRACTSASLINHSAKYIEGLENRLGRMEALLKLSGLLSDEDVDRTDLGTLEKKLADKTSSKSNEVSPANSPPSLTVSQLPPIPSPHTPGPQVNKMPSPQSSAASPKQTEVKKPEEEVEALSDMMCSLVTNNLGETRYIGKICADLLCDPDPHAIRLIIGILHIFSQGYIVDKREDW